MTKVPPPFLLNSVDVGAKCFSIAIKQSCHYSLHLLLRNFPQLPKQPKTPCRICDLVQEKD